MIHAAVVAVAAVVLFVHLDERFAVVQRRAEPGEIMVVTIHWRFLVSCFRFWEFLAQPAGSWTLISPSIARVAITRRNSGKIADLQAIAQHFQRLPGLMSKEWKLGAECWLAAMLRPQGS